MERMDVWLSFIDILFGEDQWVSRGNFKGTSCFRQGDPLSPFLFTLVADGLGRLVDTVKINGLFSGFKIGRENIEV